jgi:IS5 family transposase
MGNDRSRLSKRTGCQVRMWIKKGSTAVAMRPGKRRALPDTESGRLDEQIERIKAGIRAKVEHPFHIIKNRFGLRKVRYRGLAKNTAQLFTLFGLANLLIAKGQWFALHAQGASCIGQGPTNGPPCDSKCCA